MALLDSLYVLSSLSHLINLGLQRDTTKKTDADYEYSLRTAKTGILA